MRFTTIENFTSIALLAGAVVSSTIGFAADSTEKLTGLPIHQGLQFQQEVNSPVCGKAASMNLYNAPPDASLAEYVAWHKQQFKNFHYVHNVWGDRAQELFYSPDGSRGVGITGTPDGKRVFAVTYMKFSSTLTARCVFSQQSNLQVDVHHNQAIGITFRNFQNGGI